VEKRLQLGLQLALAGNWPMAAALIIAQRTGRTIRKPSIETMLSFSDKEMGSVSMSLIPILYALAMAMAGVSSLLFGRLLDKAGFQREAKYCLRCI
jgi:hypothetical protein